MKILTMKNSLLTFVDVPHQRLFFFIVLDDFIVHNHSIVEVNCVQQAKNGIQYSCICNCPGCFSAVLSTVADRSSDQSLILALGVFCTFSVNAQTSPKVVVWFAPLSQRRGSGLTGAYK